MKFLLFLIITFTVSQAEINKYLLTGDELVDPRAQAKITEIGDEVKKKFNINLYLDIKEDNGIKREINRKDRIAIMKQKEQELVKKLQKPYAVLTLSIEQTYANILMSDDLKEVLDRDDILDGYVIPLLASKDKNNLYAKISAASLNGFAQMGDSIAKSKNVKLDSSIGSEGKTAGTIWKVFMYTLVLSGIVLYTIIILREKKYRKLQEDKEK
ncbi:MAG: hypothetical protein U9R37_05600 [Campylobacterota bacterium]|nr:hypothetical protein [Campylobacterota bacterium]